MKEIEQKLNKLYTELENEKPPAFASPHERSYNNGFYEGRLNAMEKVCQELLGKSGDDIKV